MFSYLTTKNSSVYPLSNDFTRIVTSTKDLEFDEDEFDLPKSKVRPNFTTKKVLTWIFLVAFAIGIVFAVGVVAAACETSFHSQHPDLDVESSGAEFEDDGQLAARNYCGDCHDDEGPVAFESPVSRVIAHDHDSMDAAQPEQIGDNLEEGFTIPISTRTELSTIYSVSMRPKTTLYPITEQTSSVVSEETGCVVSLVTTETKTALVTVTVLPTTSASWSGYVTITGEPSTLTEVNTDTSYTSGLPDVTVSNGPSTLTNVQTDLSYTSGLPDVTVSGNPSTLTNVWTDVSVAPGLPDVTVSQNPSTITNVDASYSLTSSHVISNMDTSKLTIIISDLWDTLTQSTTTTETSMVSLPATVTITTEPYSPPAATPTSSENHYTSSAKGNGISASRDETVTSTNSITATVYFTEPPYPSNRTTMSYGTGTVSSIVSPTTPVVVSGSTKMYEPRINGGNLAYTMMLIAVIMLLL